MKRFVAIILVVALMLSISAVAEGWMIADGGQSNVRSAPDINSESIGVIKKGETIYVYDKIKTRDGRTWCHVEWKNRDAYISDKYMSDVDEYVDVDDGCEEMYYDEEYEVAPWSYMDVEFVIKDETNVYEWCGRSADSFGLISKGSIIYGSLMSYSEGEFWLEVSIADNGMGYIPMKSIRLANGTLPKLANRMNVTGNSVNIRTDCSTKSKSLKSLYKGDQVLIEYFIFGDDGTLWACVHSGDTRGFVSCRYLKAK